MNKAIIIGNLGRDPELRTTNSGTAVCSLSVATTSRYKDKSGSWQDKTEWHRVTVFGKSAENCDRYLSKGKKVAVEGRIETQEWQDKSGNKRYTTKIIADRVEFLSPKGSSGGGYGGESNNFDDDDIPF